MSLADLAGRPGSTSADVTVLLEAEETSERILTAAETALRLANLEGRCPNYLAALTAALQDQPPYGTKAYCDAYRAASMDRRWMAASLLTNAHGEGEGATRLWSMAACAEDGETRDLLKQHAVDESGHALFYLSFVDLALPGSIAPEFRSELRQLSPGYSMTHDPFVVEDNPYGRTPTIDDFIQVNIAEIRTTVHHLLQRRALLHHADPEVHPRLMKLLDRLLHDELRHVGYTAKLIETMSAAAGRDRLARLFCKRFSEFNELTIEQLGQGIFE